jgi:hypothetical protein
VRIGAGLAAVALSFAALPAAADCKQPFADPNDVLAFHLQTTTTSWEAFKNSQSSGCDDQYPYFPAQFRCGDEEPYIAIEFRRKRDRSETRQKLPIKLDFNRSVAGQRWPETSDNLGFRKLTLNSGQSDDAGRSGSGRPANPGTLSALLTEQLAWRLMREVLPEASRVAYARLTLHFSDTGAEQYQGLYVLIEDIDRTAIRARFGVDEGLLVKTTDLACVDEEVFDDGPPNAASELFSSWLASDPGSFPDGWYAKTDEAMHLDPLLRQEALRELLANTADTVLGNHNNYFALDLRGERRFYLPWDLDDMFRPFPQVRAPETPLVRNCTGGVGCNVNTLGLKVRDNAEIRPRYLEAMCQLSKRVALESKLLAEMEALDALVRPIVATEVEPLWAASGRDPLDAAAEGTYASEFERMKTWIPARIRAVRALIEAEGVPCPPGCEPGDTLACALAGVSGQRLCMGDSWSACQVPNTEVGAGGAGGSSGGDDAGGGEPGGAGGNAGAGENAGGRKSSGGAPASATAGDAAGGEATEGGASATSSGGIGPSGGTNPGGSASGHGGASEPSAGSGAAQQAFTLHGGCACSQGPGSGATRWHALVSFFLFTAVARRRRGTASRARS